MNFAQSTSCDAYFYYITKDYHVIFLYQTSASGTLVYDLDTTLTFPCDLKQYYEEAIKDNKSLKPEYHRYIVGSMLIQIQILFFKCLSSKYINDTHNHCFLSNLLDISGHTYFFYNFTNRYKPFLSFYFHFLYSA